MDRSLNDFVRACEVHIEAEQRMASPDTWLIALLCDAVRLSREMVLMQERLDARLAHAAGPPDDRLRGPGREGLTVPLALQPITFAEACEFLLRHHRHHPPPVGWLFGTAVNNGQAVVGVAMVGRPVARHLNDGWTVEITRCCTDEHAACGQQALCGLLAGGPCAGLSADYHL